MKFTVEKASLEKAIMTALGAVSSKAAIPSLEGLLLTASDRTLTVTGYDLEIGITSTIYCDIDEDGSIVLAAGKLSEIVRALPSDTIKITVNEDGKTELVGGSAVFNIIGTQALEYPELPTFEYHNTVRISQTALQSMIRQTIFACSSNELKPIFTGCLFEANGEDLTVVGVDGYRLAIRREKIKNTSEEPLEFVIPSKTLSRLARMLTEGSENEVVINIADRNALFSIENNTLVTRLIDGEFLNYKKTLIFEKKIEVVASVKEIADSVKRASLIINERQRSPIKLAFNDDAVSLECVSPIGKVQDSFSVQSSGGELIIGFNNKYLLDAFANTREDTVKIQLKDPLSPMVISPLEGDKFTFLVLPVRLKENNLNVNK